MLHSNFVIYQISRIWIGMTHIDCVRSMNATIYLPQIYSSKKEARHLAEPQFSTHTQTDARQKQRSLKETLHLGLGFSSCCCNCFCCCCKMSFFRYNRRRIDMSTCLLLSFCWESATSGGNCIWSIDISQYLCTCE